VTNRIRFLSLILLVGALLGHSLAAQRKISAAEAKDHVGETATVCGSVVSICGFNEETANILESRQAVSESGFHRRDLGKQSE